MLDFRKFVKGMSMELLVTKVESVVYSKRTLVVLAALFVGRATYFVVSGGAAW